MLVRIQDDWFAADQVTAVLARKDQAEHPVALLMIDGGAVPIHAQDSDTAYPTDFAAEIARTINYALDSVKFESEDGDASEDGEKSESSYPFGEDATIVLGPGVFAAADGSVLNWSGRNFVPQTPRTESDSVSDDDMHAAWFKQGWEALAKDLYDDVIGNVAGPPAFRFFIRSWLREHGLGGVVEATDRALKEEREQAAQVAPAFEAVDGHSAEAALAERAAEPVKAKDLPKRPDPERDGPDYEADNDDEQAEGPAVRAPLAISREAVDAMVRDLNPYGQKSSYTLGREIAERLGYKVLEADEQ